MTIYDSENDVLKGDKIVCEARKISNIRKINKSGRHKAQQVTLTDNAKCTIIKKARYIGEK